MIVYNSFDNNFLSVKTCFESSIFVTENNITFNTSKLTNICIFCGQRQRFSAFLVNLKFIHEL